MKDKHQSGTIVCCGRRALRDVDFFQDPEVVAWADASVGCNTLPVNVLAHTRFECETKSDDSVVAWTDGACVCNQNARSRRAGCAVFFSTGDDRTRSFSLPAREQTNNPAELRAAIAAMRVQEGNLEIRSDSEYVVRIAAGLWQGERQAMQICGPSLYLS